MQSACYSAQSGWLDSVMNVFKKSSVPQPIVRVLILNHVDHAELEIKGVYTVDDPNEETAQNFGTRFIGKKRPIEVQSNGLKWGEEFPGTHQIRIKPEEKETEILINGERFKGTLFIYQIGDERVLSAVEHLSLEEFLPFELSRYNEKKLEPETLAALAIIARTNAYYQHKYPKSKFWDVNGEKIGYFGELVVEPEIEKAIRLTRNMIMSKTGVYEGKATPFPARFDHLDMPDQKRELMESKLTLDEANELAKNGEDAAKILAKAFPGTTIMLIDQEN
jgi:stage II sporulation protein D